MARSFAAASNQYFRATSVGATTYPLSMHCLFKPASTPGLEVEYRLISLYKATGLEGFSIGYYNRLGTPLVRAIAESGIGGNTRFPHKDVTLTVGTWYAITAVFTNATTIAVYVDAVAGGSDITSGDGAPSPSGVSDTFIGISIYNTSNLYGPANGSIAEAAIWNVALTADEVLSIGQCHYSPMLVRPQSLVGYWPLLARATNEEDWTGQLTLTNTNSATAAEHPYMIYPYANRQAIIVEEGQPMALRHSHLATGVRRWGKAAA